ncbi:MAG: recombination mediator RecR [Verrucomicrobiota bacterium]
MAKRANYPAEVVDLINSLKRLPGVGPRSAERIVIWLLDQKDEPLRNLAESLLLVDRVIQRCGTCGFYSASASSCDLCNDSERDHALLCIVEEAVDIMQLERCGHYTGLYHSLGGRLSPLDNIGPTDLNVGSLTARLREGNVKEVILALGADVEGEATAHFLTEYLGQFEVVITRLAQGLPAGSGLEYADALTIQRALTDRVPLKHDPKQS